MHSEFDNFDYSNVLGESAHARHELQVDKIREFWPRLTADKTPTVLSIIRIFFCAVGILAATTNCDSGILVATDCAVGILAAAQPPIKIPPKLTATQIGGGLYMWVFIKINPGPPKIDFSPPGYKSS